MEFYQYAKAEFQGPGGIVITLKELCFSELIPEAPAINFPAIWSRLKESSLLNIGNLQGNTSFGPFIRQKIIAEDFSSVNWEETVQLINGFITTIPEFYFKSWHKSIERDIIKERVMLITQQVPKTKTKFFVFNHAYTTRSQINEKRYEHTDIDLFFSLLGINNEYVYSLSIWSA